MRLSTIELKGFKSFANETVVHFNEPVIAVVGPNGAGKSNIVDAIRWVLGEQKSKDLRLEKMGDVIFNGSKNRKPGGLAFVSLTFENSRNILPTEYQTVSISRYLYRNGDSEYRLNNVPCRLKDIRSLFMDTGIGSNSYAIIALDMVEDILSDKENARRRMFEQAAGISKYKNRKQETLNKLAITQADLDRVEDLLFEIEQNLKSFEKQAKRTKKYFKLKDRYKEVSIRLAILESEEKRSEFDRLSNKIQLESEKYRQLETKLLQEEASLSELKRNHLDKEKSLSEYQRKVNDFMAGIRSAENEKQIVNQRIDFLDDSQKKLIARIDSNEQKYQDLIKRAEALKDHINRELKLTQRQEEELKDLKSSFDQMSDGHGSIKTQLGLIVEQQNVHHKESIDLEKQIAINESGIRTLQNEVVKSEDGRRQRLEESSLLAAQLEMIRNNITGKKTLIDELENLEFQRMQEIEVLEKKEDRATKKLQDLHRQIDARNNEFLLVKNLVEKLEGFPDSVKFLNEKLNWKRNAHLLSDLIYCSEEFRVTIENFLEPYLNYYVVDDYITAIKAIDLLTEAQIGRANFFILEAFSGSKSETQEIPHSIPAIEIVEIEDKFKAIGAWLLQNVYIVDTDFPDLGDLHKQNPNLVFLSKSGKYIKRKHSLSGGSTGLFEGKKLGRQKNLKKIKSQIDSLQDKIAIQEGELDDINDLLQSLESEENERLDQEKAELEELLKKEVYLSSRLELYQNTAIELDQHITTSKNEIMELENANREIRLKMDVVQSQLKEDKIKHKQFDDQFNLIASQISSEHEKFNQKHVELVRQQARLDGQKQELSFVERQISDLKHQLDTDRQQRADYKVEKETLITRLDSMERQLGEDYQTRKGMERGLSGMEQEYFDTRGGINEHEEMLSQSRKVMAGHQTILNEMKNKHTELRFDLNQVKERLKIEFAVDLSESLEKDNEIDEPLDSLIEQSEKLKDQIQNFGEINPLAVEAFDEMSQRYDDISSQRDDVMTARDDLLETIQEIESTAIRRFMDAFENIQTNFVKVFRSLFSEDDNCDLVLLDPQDPLTSPIEIIAKPKGKRPKTIGLLSGGEKTLTAVALLFSLYLLKPAPFCIFDEVDAPLDDANIEKFNKIVKEFSRDSQFVIVTHNKLTMASADVIYGVFMEDQGISGVSAVDFRDYKFRGNPEKTAK